MRMLADFADMLEDTLREQAVNRSGAMLCSYCVVTRCVPARKSARASAVLHPFARQPKGIRLRELGCFF
jgi:hypothetical protein